MKAANEQLKVHFGKPESWYCCCRIKTLCKCYGSRQKKTARLAIWMRGYGNLSLLYRADVQAPHSENRILLRDARIDFDLRTAVPSGGPPRAQPRWLSAVYGSCAEKKGTIIKSRWASYFATNDARSSAKGTRLSSPLHHGSPANLSSI
jgi:hypothetical protein